MFRYYRWLYRQYNKVGMTAGNKTLVLQSDGSYRPAGWKGQILGNVIVSTFLALCFYGYYRLGKQDGKNEIIFGMDEESYDRWLTSTGHEATVDEWQGEFGENLR